MTTFHLHCIAPLTAGESIGERRDRRTERKRADNMKFLEAKCKSGACANSARLPESTINGLDQKLAFKD